MWLSNDGNGDDDNVIFSNPGLMQGARMQSYEDKLLDDAGPHLDMLSITSDPALLSPIESMEGNGATTSIIVIAHMARSSPRVEASHQVGKT